MYKFWAIPFRSIPHLQREPRAQTIYAYFTRIPLIFLCIFAKANASCDFISIAFLNSFCASSKRYECGVCVFVCVWVRESVWRWYWREKSILFYLESAGEWERERDALTFILHCLLLHASAYIVFHCIIFIFSTIFVCCISRCDRAICNGKKFLFIVPKFFHGKGQNERDINAVCNMHVPDNEYKSKQKCQHSALLNFLRRDAIPLGIHLENLYGIFAGGRESNLWLHAQTSQTYIGIQFCQVSRCGVR